MPICVVAAARIATVDFATVPTDGDGAARLIAGVLARAADDTIKPAFVVKVERRSDETSGLTAARPARTSRRLKVDIPVVAASVWV